MYLFINILLKCLQVIVTYKVSCLINWIKCLKSRSSLVFINQIWTVDTYPFDSGVYYFVERIVMWQSITLLQDGPNRTKLISLGQERVLIESNLLFRNRVGSITLMSTHLASSRRSNLEKEEQRSFVLKNFMT